MIRKININFINQTENIKKIKLDVKNSHTKIKRVKLNYLSACKRTTPVALIPVSSSKIEELDISIRKKCRQNALERIASYEKAKHFIVR